MSVCVFCYLSVALYHLTGVKPCGKALLSLTLGWTYRTHQRCNKSIAGCSNLSEGFGACEQHISRFPHLTTDMCLTRRHLQMKWRLSLKTLWEKSGSSCDCGKWKGVCVFFCMCACVCVHLSGVFQSGKCKSRLRKVSECQAGSGEESFSPLSFCVDTS